jgi:hypothetical protein
VKDGRKTGPKKGRTNEDRKSETEAHIKRERRKN